MKILLDSHVLVWFVLGHPRCRPAISGLIARSDVTVFVSAVSAWELATKARIGKWPEVAPIVQNFAAIVVDQDFTALPVALEHGRIAGLFESPHRDPFDRMLAAQAKVEAMPLVTADEAIRSFGIDTIW